MLHLRRLPVTNCSHVAARQGRQVSARWVLVEIKPGVDMGQNIQEQPDIVVYRGSLVLPVIVGNSCSR